MYADLSLHCSYMGFFLFVLLQSMANMYCTLSKVFGQIGLIKQCRPISDAAELGIWSLIKSYTVCNSSKQYLDISTDRKMDLFKVWTNLIRCPITYAWVTFAPDELRYICLPFSVRFFRHRRWPWATGYGVYVYIVYEQSAISCTGFRRRTDAKPYEDRVEIVRKSCNHRAVSPASARKSRGFHAGARGDRMVTIRSSSSFGRSGLQWSPAQLAFYVNLHRAVIGPSATLTGRWRPDIDLRKMLTGLLPSPVLP